MWRSGIWMVGPRVSYGLTENLQVSVSGPFDVTSGEHPTGRFTAMMPGIPEVETLFGWRFLHTSTGVSTRNEATLYAGGSATTQHIPREDGRPLEREPGVYGALAAGRVARSYDVWAGAGYEAYGAWDSTKLDRQSRSFLSSLVVGWRPSLLNREYPSPDLRFFLETTGESIGRAQRDPAVPSSGGGGGGGHSHDIDPFATATTPTGAVVLPNSGGSGIFSGPTFLCTYRSIAFQGGALLALLSQPNGTQPHEKVRAVVGVTYYFFRGRR
jgi:hypothetical protein